MTTATQFDVEVEDIMLDEIEIPEDKDQPSRLARWLSWFELASALRMAGSGIVVLAIGVFLFQNWQTGDDLFRYGLLLAETLALGLLGFATNALFKEPKSARLLLGLGLVSTIASTTVLAALLYSKLQLDGVPGDYPAFAVWQLADLADLLWLLPGSLALLLPLVWIGMRVMAGPATSRLTLLFGLGMGLLLLPVREPGLIVALAGVGTLLMLQQGFWLRDSHPALRTHEGLFARLVLMLPMAVMLTRSMTLYAGDIITHVLLSLLAYGLLRQITGNLDDENGVRLHLERLAVLVMPITAFYTIDLLNALNWLNNDFSMLSFGLITAGLLVDLGARGALRRNRYWHAAAWLAVLGAGGNLLFAHGLAPALAVLTITALGVAYAWSQRHTALLVTSAALFLYTIGQQVYELIAVFDLGGWGTLALLGMTIIVLGAVVERHGERLKALVSQGIWQQ